MTATCKKSDVLEMRISSSGYTLISLLSKDCLKSKAPDLLRLKYTTRGARSAAIRNHSINPGNDTGGIAPAGTMYRYRGMEGVPCTSPDLNKLGIFF